MSSEITVKQFCEAIRLMSIAHQDQFDKSNKPYVLHPITVMMEMETEEEMMVAALHDVIEDTQMDIKSLMKFNIPMNVVHAVDAISRRDGETVKSYYERVIRNPLALKIKIKDLEHNMDLTRLKVVTKKDLERSKFYHEKWVALKKILELEYEKET